MSGLWLPPQATNAEVSSLPQRHDEPSVSADIRRGLAEIDPKLSLKWLPVFKRWAICMAWEEGDERWAWVQRGEYPREEARDLLDYLPGDATADDAYSHIVRTFQRVGQYEGKASVARLLERVHAYNKGREIDAALDAGGEALNYASVMPIEAVPRVQFADGVSPQAVQARGARKRAARVVPAPQQPKE
jgi:hypothetical protein